MLKDLNNLYKRIITNISGTQYKKITFHVEASEISAKLNEVFQLKGSETLCLLEWQSNTLLAYQHKEDFDVLQVSKGISSILEAEISTINSLKLNATLEDISIIMDEHIHIIYLLKEYPEFCLYFVCNPSYSNLALAKSSIATLANTLSDIHRMTLEKFKNKEA